MRSGPNIKLSDRLYDCTFLVSGYDTLEESASVFVFRDTWDWLDAHKENARRKNKGDNQAYTVVLGGMEFQIKPHGGDGVVFILSNDLYTLAIRPAETEFNLSVAYRSPCLWQKGVTEARRLIWDTLLKEMKPRRVGPIIPDADPEKTDVDPANPDESMVWRKISRVDFAFDFHSPEFTGEVGYGMADRVVCHSSSKCRYDLKFDNEEKISGYIMGTSTRVQTLTIGSKQTLQIQVYDKSAEITEKSGKTWMYRLWERAGLEPAARHSDVWRIEVRFCRSHLSARNIDTFQDFERAREELLSEALASRRLTDPSDDSNRRRWPVHPMWGRALELSGMRRYFLPLGRQTEKASEVIAQEAIRDVAAGLRRFSVARTGGDDRQVMSVMLMNLLAEMDADPDHAAAIEKYQERYKYVDCAR